MAQVPLSGSATLKAPASTSGNVILEVAVEVVGVALLALLAGADDDAGKMIVLFMTGLWAVFMITNPSVVAKIAGLPATAQGKAAQ